MYLYCFDLDCYASRLEITNKQVEVEEKESTYKVLNGSHYKRLVKKENIGKFGTYGDSVFLLEDDLEKCKKLLKGKYQEENKKLEKRIQDNNKIIQLCE